MTCSFWPKSCKRWSGQMGHDWLFSEPEPPFFSFGISKEKGWSKREAKQRKGVEQKRGTYTNYDLMSTYHIISYYYIVCTCLDCQKKMKRAMWSTGTHLDPRRRWCSRQAPRPRPRALRHVLVSQLTLWGHRRCRGGRWRRGHFLCGDRCTRGRRRLKALPVEAVISWVRAMVRTNFVIFVVTEPTLNSCNWAWIWILAWTCGYYTYRINKNNNPSWTLSLSLSLPGVLRDAWMFLSKWALLNWKPRHAEAPRAKGWPHPPASHVFHTVPRLSASSLPRCFSGPFTRRACVPRRFPRRCPRLAAAWCHWTALGPLQRPQGVGGARAPGHPAFVW